MNVAIEMTETVLSYSKEETMNIDIPFIDELKEEVVEQKIMDLLNELKNYSPIQVLKGIKLIEFVSRRGKYSEVQDSIEDLQIRSAKRYLTSIYMSYKINYVEEEKECTLANIQTLIKYVNEACQEVERYLFFKERLGSTDSGSAWLHEQVDGRTYPCFASPMVAMLLKAQENLLKLCYGISFDDFENGLYELARQLLSIRIPPDKKLDKSSVNFVDEIIEEDNICVETITQWPKSLIKDLSYELGEENTFFHRDKYAGWYNVEMPITKKPFLRIEDKSYCFDHSICFDVFYRALQKAVQKKGYINQWKENQTIVSEVLPGEMLESVFCGAEKYQNVFYKDGNQWMEADGVLVYGNMVLNYEVKGGAYTPDSIFLNLNSHEKAEKNLILNAVDQAKRFQTILTREGKLDLCDAEHRVIKRISINKDTLLIPMALTIEPLGEIACMVGKNEGEDENLQGIIVLSLHDLMIYCNFFKSPIFFAHYLSKRKKIINEISLQNDDELNYLAFYLSNPNFFEEINRAVKIDGNDISRVILGNEYEEIDEYFAKFPDGEAPSFCVNEVIENIIRTLDQSDFSNKIEIGLQLLDMPKRNQKLIVKNLKEIVARQEKQKRFSSMIITDSRQLNPILLFSNGGHIYSTPKKAREYSIAYVLASQCDSAQYLIVNGNIKDGFKVYTGKVTAASAVMYQEGYFDELIFRMCMLPKSR